MRTFQDGKIKADCFSEERLLAFPPSCGVMLIMLNRFHNYCVGQLALINEGDRFKKPRGHESEEQREAIMKKYDNDLFQTGRLVTCGLYINITLYDYLRYVYLGFSIYCFYYQARRYGNEIPAQGTENAGGSTLGR